MTASGEIVPGIATLSLYGSTYTSPYIAFLPTEQCTDIQSSSTSPAVEDCNGCEPLHPVSPTAYNIFLKYDFLPQARLPTVCLVNLRAWNPVHRFCQRVN